MILRTRSRALRGGPRLVPLTRDLLRLAVTLERDGATRANTNLLQFDLDPKHNFACLDGGVFVGAGGVHTFGDGTREAWMLVSLLATKRQLVRALHLARARLDEIGGNICCYVRCDGSDSFLRAIGFAPSRTIRHALGGVECCLYQRGG